MGRSFWDVIFDPLNIGGKTRSEIDRQKTDIQVRIDEEIDKITHEAKELEEHLKKAAIIGGIATFVGIGALIILHKEVGDTPDLIPELPKNIIKKKTIKKKIKKIPIISNILPDDDVEIAKLS